MKCRFCGKKMKNGAVYCSKCGKKQTVDALPEGYEDYEEYVDVTYTDYEEPAVFDDFDTGSDYTPPVQPKKKAQPRLPLIPIIAVAVVALALLMLLGGLGGGSGEEYDLLWPDLMSYLGEGNYTVHMPVSGIEPGGEDNEGMHGYIYEIWMDKDQESVLDDYRELLEEEYHFDLDKERNGYYYYTHTGTNAPEPAKANKAEYHCLVAVVEETDDQMRVRCVWLDPLERVMVSSGGKNQGQTPTPTQTQKPTQSKEEYPLYWPDVMLSMKDGTYTQELVTVKTTQKSERNYGLTCYMGKICVTKDPWEQIQNFVDMVQKEYHFELVLQENGKYYFRFTGANAPVTMKTGDLEYHCFMMTTEVERGVLVAYEWMTDFSTNIYNAKMEPVQTSIKPMPEETEPVGTKPVETKPVETTEPEPEFGASYLPYFLDEDRSGKFYLRYPEKLSDGDRVLFRVDTTGMEYIVEEYIDMMYDLGYKLVRTDGKDRSTWYVREWYLTCDSLPDSGKDWHVHIHVKGDTDDSYTTLTIDMIGGVKMDQVFPENGGGGGGSDWDDDNDDYRPNCAMCGGDGKCSGCGGDGYKWSYGMDREKLNCSDCNASGRCWYCGGSGKR